MVPEDDYRAALQTVLQLQVVNDNAERGLAVIEEFNTILTKKRLRSNNICRWYENTGLIFLTAIIDIVLNCKGTSELQVIISL